MYYLYPIFYLLNGLAIHKGLTTYSPVYKTADYAIQHELVGRWNNAMTQVALAAAIFLFNSPEWVDSLYAFFMLYLFSDMIHMLLYCYDWVFYVHHTIPILVYYTFWNFLSVETKMAMAFATGVLELTTPPISLVWSLSKLKLKGWYTLYLSAFAYFNFFGIRILFFPYYWYTSFPLLIQVITLPFHGMNIFWFGKMTTYLLKSTP